MWVLLRLQLPPPSPHLKFLESSPSLRSRSSMPPPASSVEQTAESAGQEGQQPHRRSLPTPFLTKTYQIVDDPVLDNIISWNKDGSTFIVWRPAELSSELLPKLFKHNNFSSFVRQLNTYGFRKIVPDRWEFGNESFRRGERHLLSDIHRRKVPAAAPPVTPAAMTAVPVAAPTLSAEEHVLSPNSSSGVAAPPAPPRQFLSANLIEENERLRSENSKLEEIGLMEENKRLKSENSMLKETIGLIEENDRLRSENSTLKEEIGEMKGVCDRIKMLMSNYSASQQAGEVASVVTALELMSSGLASDEVEGPAGARLFGVTIGAKRAREEAGDERKVAVKSEAESSEAAEARSSVL